MRGRKIVIALRSLDRASPVGFRRAESPFLKDDNLRDIRKRYISGAFRPKAPKTAGPKIVVASRLKQARSAGIDHYRVRMHHLDRALCSGILALRLENIWRFSARGNFLYSFRRGFGIDLGTADGVTNSDGTVPSIGIRLNVVLPDDPCILSYAAWMMASAARRWPL